jgi:hypothetical protein
MARINGVATVLNGVDEKEPTEEPCDCNRTGSSFSSGHDEPCEKHPNQHIQTFGEVGVRQIAARRSRGFVRY